MKNFLRENVNADDDDHESVPVKKEDFINFTFAADQSKVNAMKKPAGPH